MLICKVQGAALENIEAFLPSDKDYEAIDRAIAAVGRRALRGKATKDKLEAGEEKKEAMSTKQVLREWRLATSKTEARVRRLRWYQSWARNPTEHTQELAAVLGDARAEKGKYKCLNEDGTLNEEGANPWARRLLEDVEALAALDDASDFVERLAERIKLLFADFAEEFVEIDASALRALAVTSSFAPPGYRRQSEEENDADEDAKRAGEGHVCNIDGCSAWFPSTFQLCNHIRHKHHLRNLAAIATVNNQCCNCKTVFSTNQAAKRHLEEAIDKGYCREERATTLRAASKPDNFNCQMCEAELANIEELHNHIVSHLPPLLVLSSAPSATLTAEERALKRLGRHSNGAARRGVFAKPLATGGGERRDSGSLRGGFRHTKRLPPRGGGRSGGSQKRRERTARDKFVARVEQRRLRRTRREERQRDEGDRKQRTDEADDVDCGAVLNKRPRDLKSQRLLLSNFSPRAGKLVSKKRAGRGPALQRRREEGEGERRRREEDAAARLGLSEERGLRHDAQRPCSRERGHSEEQGNFAKILGGEVCEQREFRGLRFGCQVLPGDESEEGEPESQTSIRSGRRGAGENDRGGAAGDEGGDKEARPSTSGPTGAEHSKSLRENEVKWQPRGNKKLDEGRLQKLMTSSRLKNLIKKGEVKTSDVIASAYVEPSVSIFLSSSSSAVLIGDPCTVAASSSSSGFSVNNSVAVTCPVFSETSDVQTSSAPIRILDVKGGGGGHRAGAFMVRALGGEEEEEVTNEDSVVLRGGT